MAEYEDTVNDQQVNNLINQLDKSDAENVKLNQVINSISTEKRDGNFLHHQISTDDMLDKLEHFYRGDKQGYDSDGNLEWQKETNSDLITFNEFGASSLMEIITKYIDKNTILSDYTEDRINEIIGDIGDELILFVLCNYHKMGMNTYFKKTKFRLIIATTTHTIESTYRRAKNGATMKELNQSKVVGQFGSPQQMPQGRPRREGIFNKMFN